jgi:hypothetical protein
MVGWHLPVRPGLESGLWLYRMPRLNVTLRLNYRLILGVRLRLNGVLTLSGMLSLNMAFLVAIGLFDLFADGTHDAAC